MTTTIDAPAVTAETTKQAEFTEAEHMMLDAMNVPTNRFGRALLFREMHRTGLDPFAKHLYLREDWNKKANRNVYSVASTIAGFEIVAKRQPTYEGQTAPQWCDKNGKWFEVWVADAPPVAARIGVYVRGYREPMWGIARFNEYKPEGSGGFMWSRMASHMIAKVAEALAIRKAYPDQLSGVYTDDEMQQADAKREEKEPGTASGRRPMQRRASRSDDEWNAVPAEAAREQQDVDAEAPQDSVAPEATQQQLEMIAGGLKVVRGVTEYSAILTAVSQIAAREIGRPDELTAEEADLVLTTLRDEQKAKAKQQRQQSETAMAPDVKPTYASGAQLAALKKALAEQKGIAERTAILAWCAGKVERQLGALKDLHPDEADRLLGELTPDGAENAPLVERLTTAMRASVTSDELADVSERMWTEHEAGNLTQADVSKLQDISLKRESEIVTTGKAAA